MKDTQKLVVSYIALQSLQGDYDRSAAHTCLAMNACNVMEG